MWDEINYPFLDFGAAIEDCEWMSNSFPHFTDHMITYPC